MTDGTGNRVLFLYGADMRPEPMRHAQPGARFVARGWVAGADLRTPIPTDNAANDVWGILIEVRAPAVDEATATGAAGGTTERDGAADLTVTATTDDGRTIAASAVTSPDAVADLAAMVAAARYWELPPAYVAALAASLPRPA